MKNTRPGHATAARSHSFTHAFKGLFRSRAAGQALEDALQKRMAAHWARIDRDGITAARFIEFLAPVADLQGLLVSPGTESMFFSLR